MDDHKSEVHFVVTTVGRWGRRLGKILTVIIVLVVTFCQVVHVLEVSPLKGWSYVPKLAEIAPTTLAAALLAYLIFERLEILAPTKKEVSSISSALTKLSNLANREDISKLFNEATSEIINQAGSSATVAVCLTAEATYRRNLRIIKSVERKKPTSPKKFLHGIFIAADAPATSSQGTEPDYYVEFKNKMAEMAASSGNSRWDVNVLYNIVSPDRLKVVESRLSLGDEGYEVRAICLHSLPPIFSPMIMDNQDVLLAVFEESNNRVSRSIHIQDEKTAEFFADYFRRLWEFDAPPNRVFRLRSSGKTNHNELDALRELVNRPAKS